MRIARIVNFLLLLAVSVFQPASAVALADATPAADQAALWLDNPPQDWNTAGMEIPTAPAAQGEIDPRCTERERPPTTPEDEAVAAKGWKLFLPYQSGWGVTLLSGLSSYDGMCRPWDYQTFVFVDGVFAGTIAPNAMGSRTDGALDDAHLWFKDQLSAEFRRYTADDPLCCPSSTDHVEYTITQEAGGPVLSVVDISHQENS